MAQYIIDGETLKGIADAIRAKKETTGKILTERFAEEILNISGGSNEVLIGLIERSLTHLDVPDGTRKIGSSAFTIYGTIQSYTIPDSVTEIESSAFQWNTSLTSITFGKNISSIGEQAFRGCNRSNAVFDFSKCEAVPVLANANAFESTSGNKKILVPTHLHYAWKTATNWSSYASNIVHPENEIWFSVGSINNMYVAKSNITWREWVNSVGKDYGYILAEYGVIAPVDVAGFEGHSVCTMDNGYAPVLPDDTIREYHYTTY